MLLLSAEEVMYHTPYFLDLFCQPPLVIWYLLLTSPQDWVQCKDCSRVVFLAM